MRVYSPVTTDISIGTIQHWFAWHPVFTQDGYFVWLERVYRDRVHFMYEGDGWHYWCDMTRKEVQP